MSVSDPERKVGPEWNDSNILDPIWKSKPLKVKTVHTEVS